MSSDVLRSLRFRREREASWRKLEELLAQVERRSAMSLSDEDMVAIPALYRAALSSLSVARATSLDQALIDYLEALCARAYFFVYGARSSLVERVGGFFARDWPRAISSLWRETLAALALTLAGAVTAFVLVLADPTWFFAFMPGELAGGRDPNASTEMLRATLYDGGEQNGLSVFATALFTHNAQVALLAFALGFAFCLPTAFLLLQNGCLLGAFVALFVSRGLGFELGGWLLIHGVTELFAIILAGAAGIRIGLSIAFPGQLSRLASAERAGRHGGVVMVGVVIMLLIAGLLEGFARQLINLDWARWSVASASAVVWTAYFYIGGAKQRTLGARRDG